MQAHIIIHELMQSDTLQRPIIISGRMQIFVIIPCLSCVYEDSKVAHLA